MKHLYIFNSPSKPSFRIGMLMLLLAFAFSAHSQLDFKRVDSIARTKTFNGDLKLLVHELTNGYSAETMKARAIFIWVTNNIAYDYRAINNHKTPKPFICNGKNCTDKYAEWEGRYIAKVLDKREAVCDGYARLFKRMCDYAGLRTDVVPGYTKDSPSHIGNMGEQNHAWNSILLDGKFYFLDVTWASGGCSTNRNGKLNPFTKHFNNFYWLTPTDHFLRDHYPANDKLPPIVKDSREKYKNSPYIRQAYIDVVDVLSPYSGFIDACIGDTIQFKISLEDAVRTKLQVNTNSKFSPNPWKDNGKATYLDKDLLKKQVYIDFTRNGFIYEFDYIVDNKKTRYIDVLFDHQRILRFEIRVGQ